MDKFLLLKLKDFFNLNLDRDNEDKIIEDVSKSAEMKGANLWILVFAILIASIGLNVNSTAVIIGAMLISPLMGPLLALALGLSVNDFDLVKTAVKNLGFALAASLFASTFYFLITPLEQAQTEILARTTPTIFDVFIAFFGGFAGMIGVSRKTKGNVVPGVAIATALMPPLCTAGYGLATGNGKFFFGAFYLYFINCVFIFLGTFFTVRFMGFKKKVFVDKVLEKRITTYMSVTVALTIVPSIYLAYEMVTKSLTERKITEFLNQEVNSRGLVILEKKVSEKEGRLTIKLSTVGAPVTDELVSETNAKLSSYGLTDAEVRFKRLEVATPDMVAIKSAILEELYRNNEKVLKDRDQRIAFLEQELAAAKAGVLPVGEIQKELTVLIPSLQELLLSKVTGKEPGQSVLLAYLRLSGNPPKSELDRTKDWLKVRTQSTDVKFFVERGPKRVIKAAAAP